MLTKFKEFLTRKLNLLVLIAIVIVIITIIMLTISVNFFPINSENCDHYNADWQYKVDDGQYNKLELPFTVKETVTDKLTLKNKVPMYLVKGATVLIRTSQQSLRVYVEDELIYTSYNINTQKAVPSSAYHFVRLPTDSLGKTITVELFSNQPDFVGILNEMKIGSKASLVFDLLSIYGSIFIAGFMLSLAGFVLIVGSLLIKYNRKDKSMTYLGGFFISAGIWLSVESRLIQLFIPYPNMLTNLSVFALSLIPVFLSLYFFTGQIKRYIKGLQKMCIIAGALSFTIFVLTCIDIMLPLLFLEYYIVILGVYSFLLYGLLILEYVKCKRPFSVILAGIIIFGVFSTIELVCFLITTVNSNSSYFLTIGLVALSICMLIEFINNFKIAFKNDLSVIALRNLAYTDSLTGLANRTSFIEELGKIDVSKTPAACLAMFDLNNLKNINDQKGHLMGDYTLMCCANFLKHVLESSHVFRLGGDEFVAILNNIDLQTFEEKMETMKLWKSKDELYSNLVLDFAYGYAEYSAVLDTDLFSTVARADAAMYKCKQTQSCKLLNTNKNAK